MQKDFNKAKEAMERTFGNIKDKEFFVDEEMKEVIQTISKEESLLLETPKSSFLKYFSVFKH